MGEDPSVRGSISLGKEMKVAEAAEGLSQGNCLPDSSLGGPLECNIDLEQGCTGKLAVL